MRLHSGTAATDEATAIAQRTSSARRRVGGTLTAHCDSGCTRFEAEVSNGQRDRILTAAAFILLLLFAFLADQFCAIQRHGTRRIHAKEGVHMRSFECEARSC